MTDTDRAHRAEKLLVALLSNPEAILAAMQKTTGLHYAIDVLVAQAVAAADRLSFELSLSEEL
jgi:hypothetical protein